MRNLLSFLIVISLFSVAASQSLTDPSTANYLPNVPSPKSVLKFEPADWPAQHHQAVGYLKKLAEVSPRVKYFESGKTHEGRLLGYVIITSEENHKNLDAIRDKMDKTGCDDEVSSKFSFQVF